MMREKRDGSDGGGNGSLLMGRAYGAILREQGAWAA